MKSSNTKKEKPEKADKSPLYDKVLGTARRFVAPAVGLFVIGLITYGVMTSTNLGANLQQRWDGVAIEEVVEPVAGIPVAENVVLEEVVVIPAVPQAVVEEEVPVEDDYIFANANCIVLAGVITDEVERGAHSRGCDTMQVPFIDEIRVCNAISKTCILIDERDL